MPLPDPSLTPPPALPSLDGLDGPTPLTHTYGGAFEQGAGLDLGTFSPGAPLSPTPSTSGPSSTSGASSTSGPSPLVGSPLLILEPKASDGPGSPPPVPAPRDLALPPMDLGLRGVPSPPAPQPAWRQNLWPLLALFFGVAGPSVTAFAVDMGGAAAAGPEGALLEFLLKSQSPIASLIVAGVVGWKFFRDDNTTKQRIADAEGRAVRAEGEVQRLKDALAHLPTREEVASLRAELQAAKAEIARRDKAEDDRRDKVIAELQAQLQRQAPHGPTPIL